MHAIELAMRPSLRHTFPVVWPGLLQTQHLAAPSRSIALAPAGKVHRGASKVRGQVGGHSVKKSEEMGRTAEQKMIVQFVGFTMEGHQDFSSCLHRRSQPMQRNVNGSSSGEPDMPYLLT